MDCFDFDDPCDLEINDDEDFVLENEEDFYSKLFSFDELNNTDYSLNSPLIIDDVYSYWKKGRGEDHITVTKSKAWVDRDIITESAEINWSMIHSPHNNHSWWGNFNQLTIQSTPKVDRLLEQTASDHEVTHDVIRAFFKGWTGEIMENMCEEIRSVPIQIKKWGELAMHCHRLTILLNSKKSSEWNVLLKRKGKKVFTDAMGKTIGIRFKDSIFGMIVIGGGLVIFEDHNRVLDRNFLLMIKDVYIARYQTTLGLYLRKTKDYDINDVTYLNELYRKGDEVLEYNGSSSYDVFKLLEPCCNLRFCELARKERPLVPEFESFKHHITTAMDEVKDHLGSHEFLADILKVEALKMVVVVYGSFRHWGHPYIDYLEGLVKLHNQVTVQKDIDHDYANSLASDLAYIVLRRKFQEYKKWFVVESQVDKNHPFKVHIINNTWPTPKQVEDFGDKWHELPLCKCFEIPDVVDPSNLYSDKSHSMTRTEVLDFIRSGKSGPIPTLKVLTTLLNTPATDWPEFLKQIDTEGLDVEYLIIGLKAKEREIKRHGRFFSLMSWALREYFVITEYLIKTHYVPLFSGLTMADDLTTVISKLLDRTQGQGGADYSNVCIANHIDYEKWNNHQRLESTGPVFKVMGQFLGYPNLIYRTHEFFQKSIIYYNGRPDLMEVVNGQIRSKEGFTVCWDGQAGGLEGLRQKGWSILSLLVIQRESKIRNTRIKVLAQGDNQVICTQYRLRDISTPVGLNQSLQEVVQNNEAIMRAIKEGTNKLGLIINEDETMQSADYLNYGKIPIFRGRILNLFSKRLSRVMCTTNDQLPTMANVMGTVSTNALTISHFDDSPLNAIYYYDILGNMTRRMIEQHNIILRGPVKSVMRNFNPNSKAYRILSLYQDPSLGGVCGTSLTRFLTRMFPDPVTEGLSFWKKVYENTVEPDLAEICKHAGNPKLSTQSEGGFNKLMENPTSLNIPKGLSLTNLLKDEIKKCLLREASSIRNHIIRVAAEYCLQEEDRLMLFLESIDPLFPRFLSEFRSATFLGITDGLIGLFQNSRTIRSSFSRRMERDINQLVIKSEIGTYLSLSSELEVGRMWDCSATQADLLRRLSWGREVLGTTIPHPIEMFGGACSTQGGCQYCEDGKTDDFVTTLAPLGFASVHVRKGPYPAYLGSKTSESTSILQPWEKETSIPIIKRAAKMRNAINWFVDKDSNLGRSILSVLKGLTGEDWDTVSDGYKRTGSALHRFSCSRMSAGGYAATAPTRLSWMVTTTDTLTIVGSKNFDFMFQPTILFAQISVAERYKDFQGSCTVHHHLSCNGCLREISEPILDTFKEYEHPDVSHILEKWKPEDSSWSKKKELFDLPVLPIDNMDSFEISYQVGRAEGFLFGDMALSENKHMDDSSIFPLTLQQKLNPEPYFDGLLDGLLRSVSISIIHRRSVAQMKKPRPTLIGGMIHVIDLLCEKPPFLNLIRIGPLHNYLLKDPHKVPASYPISDADMGSIVRSWLKRRFFDMEQRNMIYSPRILRIVVFADMTSPEVIGPYLLSSKITPLLFSPVLSKQSVTNLRGLRGLSSQVRDVFEQDCSVFKDVDGFVCREEIRHASKHIYRGHQSEKLLNWGPEFIGEVTSIELEKSSTEVRPKNQDYGQYRCPLMSGLRLAQLATGAHYKIRTLVARLGIRYHDFICGGDGSGGMTAALLRWNRHSRGLYNSLLEYDKSSSRGAKPGAPPAIVGCTGLESRCLNISNVWEDPSDLSADSTWVKMGEYVKEYRMRIDLIVLDMEVRSEEMSSAIEGRVAEYGLSYLQENGVLIYKSYLTRMSADGLPVVEQLKNYFRQTLICQTSLSSSRTSEVYVVFRGKLVKPRRTYFDWILFQDKARNFSCNSSEQDEFDRCLRLEPKDLLKGVPQELIPDWEVELCTLLGILGVSDGISSQLAREIKFAPWNRKINSIWAMLVVGSNFIMDTTSEHTGDISIPSDPSCEKMATLELGFFYWYCWLKRDLNLFKYCNKVNDGRSVYCFSRKAIIRNKEVMTHLEWNHKGPGQIRKGVNTVNIQAGIGKIVRLLARELDCNQILEWNIVELICKRFNKSLSKHQIKRKTGLLEFFRCVEHYQGDSRQLKTLDTEAECSWRS
ncbi:polymerase [Nkolbisson virus]|uniref:Replicase n=3 Tax=Nkolbisson virus TaxID=380442 RepID=A0A0D3R263_9RHAB|nr:polymerase [Nkolbisson virus]AJR28540.1 polymerase [Nkolbisson virus]